jgi:hypothetical protein
MGHPRSRSHYPNTGLKLAGPLVVHAFRKENMRILAELKRYVEAQRKQRDLKTIETPAGGPQ